MIAEAPNFWWKKRGLLYYLLTPFSWVYSKFALKNFEKESIAKIDLPVICLGNYTLGGCGKTPLAIALAKSALKHGYQPGFVTRGYGGTVKHLHFIDEEKDCARLVGDEPLLLAKIAPTVIGINREVAAHALKEKGCDFIIMDDGFQSRRLYYDYALVLVDAFRGFGNGGVFPAGPLRAPLNQQLAYSSAVAIIGEGDKGEEALRIAARAGREIYHVIFCSCASQDVKGKSLLTFSAIGNPDKFHHSAQKLGAIVGDSRTYPDHHFFTLYDIKDLRETAERKNLVLATTSKDYARLSKDFTLKHHLGEALFEEFLQKLIVFDIFYPNDAFCLRLIQATEQKYLKRKALNKS